MREKFEDFWYWHGPKIGFFLTVAAMLVAFYTAAYFATREGCKTVTADIGYAHRFSFLGGCQIEVEPGRWIPLENWRYQEGE